MSLNTCQIRALDILKGCENVFLTGVPGSGKSYLISHFFKENGSRAIKQNPILASTGAAAVLIGGRTFHGFFGLGIGQGGPKATVERALKDRRLLKRLKTTKCAIIDEVSMLSGSALDTANLICKEARQSSLPWGGIRVIAVGDFAQLPPVNRFGSAKDWAFLSPTWLESRFASAVLKTIVRTEDPELLEILALVREGNINQKVADFLNSRVKAEVSDFDGTRFFPHRNTVEKYNLECLNALEGKIHSFETQYAGAELYLEAVKKNAPVPEVVHLKIGALVMLLQNDPEGRWVNGSLGIVKGIKADHLTILLHQGMEVRIEPTSFTLLNADGTEVASSKNFPVNLAYASTIHKAQGLTLDKAMMDLRHLWEPGQAYVALSRVKNSAGIFLTGWTADSIRVDPEVRDFYRKLEVSSVCEA